MGKSSKKFYKKKIENEKNQDKSLRKRRNKRNRIFKIIFLFLLFGIIMACCYIGYQSYENKTAVNVQAKPAAANPILAAYFKVGSLEGTHTTALEATKFTLENIALSREETLAVPVSALKDALGFRITVSDDGRFAEISMGKTKASFEADSSEVTVGDEITPALLTPFLFQKSLYVGLSDIASIYGYEEELLSGKNGMRISHPAQIPRPTLWFSTDKDTYAPGEKVEIGVMVSKGTTITEYLWENKQERYFKPGEYTITLQGKDIFGQVSETVKKTIHVGGKTYAGAGKTPVLMYHFLTDDKTKVEQGGEFYGNNAVMSTETFRSQMQYLKDNGYQTLLVSEFMSYLNYGHLPPEKSVVVIFDDGYANNYEIAFPILKELGVKASVAVILNHTDSSSANPNTPGLRYMTYDQLIEMQDSGVMEVGSHTYAGHSAEAPYSSEEGFFMLRPAQNSDLGRTETDEEYMNRVKDDLSKSKGILADKLGNETPFFVYPYGRDGEFFRKTIEDLNYSSAFVIRNMYATNASDSFRIPRFSINPTTSMEEFIKIVSGNK